MITEKQEAESHAASSQARFDPYRQFTEMPFTAVFYPLGFPVRVTTDCTAVLEAARESWGAFHQEIDMPPILLRFGVVEDGSTECPASPVTCAHRNNMVRIADPANFYVVDLLQGFTFGWLNSAGVAHTSYLRYHFLEAAAVSHIANRYATPIHAACVDWQGAGILLCGESGAGKSSLSFACARAGWTYITDDASFLLQGESDRTVVGNCHTLRLRPSAAELFEEARGKPIMPRANGKPSIELSFSELPEIRRSTRANVEYVVFLNRQDTLIQELVPYSTDSARAYIRKHLCGMEELRQPLAASIESLLTAKQFELRYRDLDWAVARLERLVREQQ